MAVALQWRKDVTLSSVSFVSWRKNIPDEGSSAVPTSIVQAYDDAGAGLLILGAPGAGKSTFLRELASELLARAEGDTTKPIPVNVNLSSWAIKKAPLTAWMVDRLWETYNIPRRLSQALIEQNQLLFLLDGLDEVELSARSKCIEAINAYLAGQESIAAIVICTRGYAYLEQAERLRLPGAVEVLPLTPQQVDGYLKGEGKPFAAVRDALRSDTVLRDLVTTPLVLSVVMRAYRGKTIEDLPHLGTAEERQRQVFEHYVSRMLDPAVKPTRKWRYPAQSTQKWLTWLAQQMNRHQLTEFHLESLQADYLSTSCARMAYQLYSRLILGLLFGLAGGLLMELVFGYLNALLFGPISWSLLLLLFSALLFFGVGFGLPGQPFEIEPVEQIAWSWNASKKGLIAGWSFGVMDSRLYLGLFGWLFGGFLGVPPLKKEHVKPNQGIHSSGWNALRLGLIFFLFTGLLIGLPFFLRFEPFVGLLFFLASGLAGGLFAALYFGGRACCQHYVLRFLLAISRTFAWRADRFFDEATERILLQRVGGGYRFIHPLFQEYFASLRSGTPASTQMQPSSSPQP